MLKRAAILGLVLSAAGAVMTPTTAFAQDGYVYGGYQYGDNRAYYPRDNRYYDEHERREWREHERAEWRQREWREHEWREHERREQRRDYRDNYRPGYGEYGR